MSGMLCDSPADSVVCSFFHQFYYKCVVENTFTLLWGVAGEGRSFLLAILAQSQQEVVVLAAILFVLVVDFHIQFNSSQKHLHCCVDINP